MNIVLDHKNAFSPLVKILAIISMVICLRIFINCQIEYFSNSFFLSDEPRVTSPILYLRFFPLWMKEKGGKKIKILLYRIEIFDIPWLWDIWLLMFSDINLFSCNFQLFTLDYFTDYICIFLSILRKYSWWICYRRDSSRRNDRCT